jgi:ATPase subunit of ABC transporter with duplicated ATPase domains
MPPLMEAISAEENMLLAHNGQNFVSWYRYISQDQSLSGEVMQELREIWSNYSHFAFVSLGKDLEGRDTKGLAAYFEKKSNKESHNGSNGSNTDNFSFTELSDGQRALIVIYTILVYAKREPVILCLDEPENYLALTEIQPWLIQLYDLCNEQARQAILISHHPEVINYLGEEAGIWFERPNDGPVKIHRLQDIHNSVELPLAELVARGWLDV